MRHFDAVSKRLSDERSNLPINVIRVHFRARKVGIVYQYGLFRSGIFARQLWYSPLGLLACLSRIPCETYKIHNVVFPSRKKILATGMECLHECKFCDRQSKYGVLTKHSMLSRWPFPAHKATKGWSLWAAFKLHMRIVVSWDAEARISGLSGDTAKS